MSIFSKLNLEVVTKVMGNEVSTIVAEYASNYEMWEQVEHPLLTEAERDLVADALEGLTADERFLEAVCNWRNLVRACAIKEG